MKVLVWSLLICAAVAAASCWSTDARPEVPSSAPTAPSQLGAAVEGQVKITRVRAFIKDARPQVFVEGELGDGCNTLQGVDQRRAADTFDITVTYRRQGEICTMIMQFVNQWVPLDGAFTPGQYLVRVNSYTTRFRLVSTPTGLRVDPDPGPLPVPPYFPPPGAEPR